MYDIGDGKYDHHQKNSRVRENGVPYAAFGLLWEQFGHELLSKVDAQAFDEYFIQPIDQSDNTGEENIISLIISVAVILNQNVLCGGRCIQNMKLYRGL